MSRRVLGIGFVVAAAEALVLVLLLGPLLGGVLAAISAPSTLVVTAALAADRDR